jgi:hypothetical protein
MTPSRSYHALVVRPAPGSWVKLWFGYSRHGPDYGRVQGMPGVPGGPQLVFRAV